MAQSLSPCDLRPCDLGWKSADRSGIGCRADKNSLLIQHGIFDRPGIRESAEHSWSSLHNDSSLTGILEVKLFDVCSSPAAAPPPILTQPPSLPLLYRPIIPCFISFTSPSLRCSVCSHLASMLSAPPSSYLGDGLRPPPSRLLAHGLQHTTSLQLIFLIISKIFSQLSSQFDPSAIFPVQEIIASTNPLPFNIYI